MASSLVPALCSTQVVDVLAVLEQSRSHGLLSIADICHALLLRMHVAHEESMMVDVDTEVKLASALCSENADQWGEMYNSQQIIQCLKRLISSGYENDVENQWMMVVNSAICHTAKQYVHMQMAL